MSKAYKARQARSRWRAKHRWAGVPGQSVPAAATTPVAARITTGRRSGRARAIVQVVAGVVITGASVATTTPTPTRPAESERAAAIVAGYRQQLARCNEGSCACLCKCHQGSRCVADRAATGGFHVRTPNEAHKPAYR